MRQELLLGGGVVIQVRRGLALPQDDEAVRQAILGVPGTNHLAPFFAAGGPGRILDAYEMLRQEVVAHTEILDGLLVGANRSSYGGNLALINRTRSRSWFGQHLVDPLADGNADGIPPAGHFFQSIVGESTSVVGNRPAFLFERWSKGDVSTQQCMVALCKRLEDQATDDGAYIGDPATQRWMVTATGIYFSRGGLLLLGDDAHAIMRGGNVFVESAGVVAVMDPDTTSDSATGASLALGRTSPTAAQIGDLYGIDLGTLTLQASVVRALAPGGVDSAFRAKAMWIEGKATRPTTFDASNWGLWVDSDTDVLYFWDGATDTALGGGSAAATTELCGYPSWSNDLGTATPDRAYAWGPFGLGTVFTGPAEAAIGAARGFESDGSRQTSYAAMTFNAEDEDLTWKWQTGVPEGFSAWGANGLGVSSKITGLGAGDTCVITLTTYNPSDGTTTTETRTITSDDASYTEVAEGSMPGTWLGLDLLRFTLKVDVTLWGEASGAITVKVGRIRTDWS